MTPQPTGAPDRSRQQVRPARSRTGGRVALLASLLVVGLTASACSSASSTPTPQTTGSTGSTTPLVGPPDVAVEDCTYAPGGTVPAGEPHGENPGFASFTPTRSAQQAVEDIAAHGGTGMVDGFEFPAGVAMYGGPDTTGSPVATVPNGRTVLAIDPVLWTTGTGAHWLAFFIACGGDNLYWVGVDQTKATNADEGAALARQIASAQAAAPYTTTGMVSTLPIKIAQRQFTWAVTPDAAHPLTPVARGEFLPY